MRGANELPDFGCIASDDHTRFHFTWRWNNDDGSFSMDFIDQISTAKGPLMKPYLEITQDNLAAMEAFAQSNDEPIVMVNLMQIRPRAEYEDATRNDCTGYEAFTRYTRGSAEVRQGVGAQLIWSGRAIQMPIGPSEKTWDMVALVRYPNASAYLTMKASAAYEAARAHRRAALLDSRLIMTIENLPLGR